MRLAKWSLPLVVAFALFVLFVATVYSGSASDLAPSERPYAHAFHYLALAGLLASLILALAVLARRSVVAGVCGFALAVIYSGCLVVWVSKLLYQ